MKKLLFILGTRPEAIKLKPIIELANETFDIQICLTRQHENISQYFSEHSVIELDLIRNEQTLSGLSGSILQLLDSNTKVEKYNPDMILVHGDTISSLCGSLYAFYRHIKLGHIESGLRTHDKLLPFPEESNRKLIDYLADLHFAPTELNRQNLLSENISASSIFIVGNSINDVLVNRNQNTSDGKYGLITLHRRENWGSNIEQAIKIISDFALNFQYRIKFVLHPNPVLQNKIRQIVANNSYFELYEPMNMDSFHSLLQEASFILTDSGGIQEECVYFGKPLFIMRDSTERQEIIESGCGYLVNKNNMQKYLTQFIQKTLKFNQQKDLYGNGTTSQQIIKHINEYFLHQS